VDEQYNTHYTELAARTVKSKAVPLHAMEALKGTGRMAPTHS